MRKTFFSALALLVLAAVPASATDLSFRGGLAFGGVIAGGTASGTVGGTFARNNQSMVGNPNLQGYAQTEITGEAGAELQAGTNLPFRANGFARTGSVSGAGSLVNGVNGSVSNSTGGFSGAGAAIGAGAAFGAAGGVGLRR
jgi:hypothetical protein